MKYLKNVFSLLIKREIKLIRYAAAAELLQSCPTLCNPIDGSPAGSPVPGILQARTLEWVAISFSNAWKWKMKVKLLSRVRLFETPWTAAYQVPLSMGFSRQEYWSGVPFPSPYKHDFCRKYISQQNKRPNKLICWICDFQNVVSVPPASASSGNLLEIQILRPYQDLLNKNSRAGGQKFVF